MEATELKKGKYTICFFNDFGFFCHAQINLDSVVERPFAQYPKVLVFNFKEKRKRSMVGQVVKPGDIFYIFEGWVDIKYKPDFQIGVVSFDTAEQKKAISGIGHKPVFFQE